MVFELILYDLAHKGYGLFSNEMLEMEALQRHLHSAHEADCENITAGQRNKSQLFYV